MSADLTEMVAFLREHIERDAQTAFDRYPEVGIMFSDHVDSIGSICDEAVRAEGDERKLWAHAVSILVSAYHNHDGFRMDWAPGNSEYHLVRLAKIREGGTMPAEAAEPNRVVKYVRAIHGRKHDHPKSADRPCDNQDCVARSVIAVADTEQAELRSEVERWYSGWKDASQEASDFETRAAKAEVEVERLRSIVETAALETYTPDGSERFVSAFHGLLAKHRAAERALADERAKVVELEAERDLLRAEADATEAIVRRIEELCNAQDEDARRPDDDAAALAKIRQVQEKARGRRRSTWTSGF